MEDPVHEPERGTRASDLPRRTQGHVGEDRLDVEAVVEDRGAADDVPNAVVGGEPRVFAEKVLGNGGVDLFEGDGGRDEWFPEPGKCEWGRGGRRGDAHRALYSGPCSNNMVRVRGRRYRGVDISTRAECVW